MQDGLRVSGQGEARGQPDVARATLGIEARAATAAEATEQANSAMQRVLAAVKGQGVAERDIQTEQLSLFFQQERPPQPRPMPQDERGPSEQEASRPEPAAARGWYRATNTARVTIRNLDRAPAILGAATSAGANAIHGISFEIDDPAPLLAEAREKAVRDAQAQAQQLAALAGARLGRVIAVSAQSHGFSPVRMASAPMAMPEHDVPLERGELTIQQTVEIVYSIEPQEE